MIRGQNGGQLLAGSGPTPNALHLGKALSLSPQHNSTCQHRDHQFYYPGFSTHALSHPDKYFNMMVRESLPKVITPPKHRH